jgi:glycosyltransferase involved in cell wall biosynthesis
MKASPLSLAGMRVALDGRSLTAPALRGMDRYTLGLVRMLHEHGLEVTLLHRAREPLDGAHLADLPCAVRGLSDRGGLSWEQSALPRALASGRFDLYHAPAERGVPLRAPCPTVMTVHSVTTESYQALVRRGLLDRSLVGSLGLVPTTLAARLADRYWRLQLHAARKLVTPSLFTCEELVSLLRVDRRRIDVTPLAADPVFSRAPSEPAARVAALHALGVRAPYLLYVGGFERHKNVEGLLSVFARVQVARPELSLVVVGTGSVPDALRFHARRLGIGEGVVFLRDQTHRLVDLYDGAELFVSMSWRESFGLPALEAMTRGVAAVASAWGASPEVIGSGGELVDPRDHPSAASAIVRWLDTDRRARRARARAAAERFSWAATADATLRTYRDLVAPVRSARPS